jgi:hypothetical protein
MNMRYTEIINELFDKALAWNTTNANDTSFSAEFEIDDRLYEVEGAAYPIDNSDNPKMKWEISFTMDGELSATGTGQEFAVFATVREVFEWFVKKYEPRVFVFTASTDEPTRVKLYNRLSKQISSKFKYQLATETKWGEAFYHFTKAQS